MKTKITTKRRLPRPEHKGKETMVDLFCPVCGKETVAEVLSGHLVAKPADPTLQCLLCWTKFRVELFEVE